MSEIFILLLMIFCHIVDDFNLQGIMANMKQKTWWRNHPEYKEMYKHDWIPSLFMHSFSWTFMIMLPIALFLHFEIGKVFLIAFGLNLIIHFIVDHLKANVKLINLCADQFVHLIQIIITFIIFIIGEWR